jgi:uncharacterized coiled-coil protein SlyX
MITKYDGGLATTAAAGRGGADSDYAARLDRLESQLAFQEASLQDLSALVIEYRGRVERLEEALKSARAKLAELAEAKEPGLPPQERPPHY